MYSFAFVYDKNFATIFIFTVWKISNLNNVPLEPLPRGSRVLEVFDLGCHPQPLPLPVPSPKSIFRLQQLVLRVICPGSKAHGVASANVDHLELAVAQGGDLPKK